MMEGGPAHIDTFDPKPGHANGGPIKPIATASAGLRISEHLPRLAKLAHHLAIFRSVWHGSDTHGVGVHYNLTGLKHAPREHRDRAIQAAGGRVAEFEHVAEDGDAAALQLVDAPGGAVAGGCIALEGIDLVATHAFEVIPFFVEFGDVVFAEPLVFTRVVA